MFDLYAMLLDHINKALMASHVGDEQESYDAFGVVAGWFLNVDDEPTTETQDRLRRLLAGLIREAHEILGQPFPELSEALS